MGWGRSLVVNGEAGNRTLDTLRAAREFIVRLAQSTPIDSACEYADSAKAPPARAAASQDGRRDWRCHHRDRRRIGCSRIRRRWYGNPSQSDRGRGEWFIAK
jgi:hypothetical protein